jgi:outer membrane protein
MKRVVLALIFPSILAAQTADPSTGARYISIQEAVEMAQQNAPAAIQSRGAIRNAQGSVKTTAAQFLPTLSVGISQSKGYGQSRDLATGELKEFQVKPWTYGNSIGIGVPVIFDGGQRMSNLAAAKANVEVAEANQVNTLFSLALQVKQQYASILAAREQESAAESQLRQARQQLAVSSAKVRAGASIVSDSLRSSIAVANAQLAILTARNSVRNASAQLTRLVGSETMVTANPADTTNILVAPVDSVKLMEFAMDGPAVRAARMSLDASRASYVTTTRAFYPTVSMNLSYSQSVPTGLSYDKVLTSVYGLRPGGSSKPSLNYGFSLNYPIFDRFGRSESKERAQVSLNNAEASLREARLVAQANMIQQLGGLRIAEEQIRLNQMSLLAAEEDLRVQEARYQLGASLLVELLTSQTAVNNARLSLIQARLNYRTARAQIEAIIGRDLP